MTVQIEGWELDVNIEATKLFYANFPYNNEDVFGLNYIEVCSFCDPQLVSFFEQLGVDILKPTNLHSLQVEGDCIMYSGSYHVIGERLQGVIDEWDVVFEHFCFALTEQNYDKPEHLQAPSFEISFEVVLPWMLFEPIPAV
ncbi:MAG: hypothetical protein ABS882_12290 [Lysinibacillus sp.]